MRDLADGARVRLRCLQLDVPARRVRLAEVQRRGRLEHLTSAERDEVADDGTEDEAGGGQPPTRGQEPPIAAEVDFGRYRRLLAARWWLPAAGLVLGAVIGYLVALGGSQVFKATATLYLGQPYSSSGNVQLQAAQTNPSTVRQIAH